MPITIYIYIPEWEVKDRIEAAVLAEREACAKVCKWVFENRYTAFDLEAQEISENYAAAIRARGE